MVKILNRITGPRLMTGSFVILIAFGTLGLRFLPGLYTGPGLGWVDSLFTATSATCVTGLIVVDTATYFTPAGQLFILVLIQLGGLGIITLSTAIILAFGGKLTLGQEEASATGAGIIPHTDLRRLSRQVVVLTLAFEAAGALVLTLIWGPRLGWATAAWHATFHSVSAFCNAGFSTFSDSLTGFSHSVPTVVVVSVLIIAGGLGFLAIDEILGVKKPTDRAHRKTLHTRLVLWTTVIVLVIGWILYAVLEWDGALAGMTLLDRLSNSLFMSTTARTAGFNTVDYAATTPGGSFLTILLMMVGGSPGSTAGGLKTTTVALVALLAWNRIRGHSTTQCFDRSIPDETVQRAVGLVVVASTVVVSAIFIFAALEVGSAAPSSNVEFLRYAFEAVSAFNTVGLSMGVTSDLDAVGRLVSVLLMLLGRVGPLTFAIALARKARLRGQGFRFASEDVVVG